MRVNVVLNCEPELKKKARYVLTILLDTLGCPYRFVDGVGSVPDELFIVYGSLPQRLEESPSPILCLKADRRTFDSPPSLQYLLFEEKKIPLLTEAAQPDSSAGTALFFCLDSEEKRWPSVFEFRRGAGWCLRVHFDLVASAFFFLSRWEEQQALRKDKHGRFPSSAALGVRAGFVGRPVVNAYISFLRFLLLRLAERAGVPLVFKSFWPKGKKVAVCLSHDVDVLTGWFLYALVRFAELLKKGSFAAAFRLVRRAAQKAFQPLYPLQILREMAHQEKMRNFRSSFYFLSASPNWRRVLKSDVTYDNCSGPIAAAIGELCFQGFEIGLHGSYDSFKDAARLAEEKRRLESVAGQPIMGIRQHFLRFAAPDTWQAQRKAGFAYDTTLGFAEQAGFRAGFGFPFFPYDLKQDGSIPILELPLVVMDRSYSKYQNASLAEVAAGIESLLEVLNEHGGLLTLLWHTHMTDEFGFFGYPQLYGRILDRFLKEDCYVASGKEIYAWWMARQGFETLEVGREGSKICWRFRSQAKMEGLCLEIAWPGDPAAFSAEVRGGGGSVQRGEEGFKIHLEAFESGQEISVLIERK